MFTNSLYHVELISFNGKQTGKLVQYIIQLKTVQAIIDRTNSSFNVTLINAECSNGFDSQ